MTSLFSFFSIARNKTILASLSGNVVEFYDFTLYAYFAPQISQTFFPYENTFTSLIAALGVFSVSYLARPLGALYFGTLGDTIGRRLALYRSVGFMGIPTLIISVIPSYEIIGSASPILLILCRIIQGFCMGGEFGGASVFLLEKTADKFQGFVCGLLNLSIVAGMMLSIIVCSICENFYFEGVWRLPFFAGGVLSVLCFLLRKSVKESPIIKKILEEKHLSLIEFFQKNYVHFFKCIIISGFAGAMFYTSFVYPKICWSLLNNLPRNFQGSYIIIGLMVYAFSSPLFGLCVPKIGSLRMLFFSVVGSAAFIPYYFSALSSENPTYPALAVIILALLASFFQVCVNLFLMQGFPVNARYRGVSLSYTIGVGLFGGTIVPLLTYLQAHQLNLLVNGYIFILCFITIIALAPWCRFGFVFKKFI